MIYLGSIIREYRMKKSLTQEQLGQELGVSTQCVSRWENGVTLPDVMTLPVIADFFDITIDQLMGRTRECSAEEREAFFSDVRQLSVSERIERLREALQSYPQDIYFMFSLANNLNQMVKTQSTRDEKMEVEIDVLCHKLLCSNNPGMQCGALYLLALMADRHGDKEVRERASVHVRGKGDHGGENLERPKFQTGHKEIARYFGIKKDKKSPMSTYIHVRF